mmetsp:Transcript_16344/g.47853  ORF Transcript_16344/g.47853 Transcript_16344/m.47853 type:complete len:227 (+) Transcript_16344:547-1227(+)
MAVISSSYARLAENTRAMANASEAPSVGAAAAIRAAFRAADAVFASSASVVTAAAAAETRAPRPSAAARAENPPINRATASVAASVDDSVRSSGAAASTAQATATAPNAMRPLVTPTAAATATPTWCATPTRQSPSNVAPHAASAGNSAGAAPAGSSAAAHPTARNATSSRRRLARLRRSDAASRKSRHEDSRSGCSGEGGRFMDWREIISSAMLPSLALWECAAF